MISYSKVKLFANDDPAFMKWFHIVDVTGVLHKYKDFQCIAHEETECMTCNVWLEPYIIVTDEAHSETVCNKCYNLNMHHCLCIDRSHWLLPYRYLGQ